MGHDGAKMGHDSAKMGIFELNLGASGAVLGEFFDDFRKRAGKRKTLKDLWFLFFFLSILGGLEEVSEASWGLSWTISEHFLTCWR